MRRAHWPNKRGKAVSRPLQTGPFPPLVVDAGRSVRNLPAVGLSGWRTRIHWLIAFADRLYLSLPTSLLSIEGYILHSISEPAA